MSRHRPISAGSGASFQALTEYELYVPLASSSKVPHPARKLAALKLELVKRFGGLTHFPQKNKGLWKIGNVTFQDDIVILRVVTAESARTRQFWKKLKRRMEAEWDQDQILIIRRSVGVV